MKKIFFSVLIACLGFVTAFAKNPPADSLEQYVGTYKMKGDSPIAVYKITFSEGSISGEADEYGANKLVKQDGEDKFKSTSSYGSIITFVRNADKKVIGLKMEIQGSELLADKQ